MHVQKFLTKVYYVVFEGFHGEDTCERGLRLHHVFFLERVMVALKGPTHA